MTARPKYVVTIENLDQSWTYSSTEGSASPLLSVAPVQLVDGLKVTYGWDKYPGQPTPTIITGALLVRAAADLPELAVGDFLQVDITRPAAAGPDLVWVSDRFVADEPVVTTHERGLLLTFTLVQWIRDLGELTVTWYDSVLGENLSYDALPADEIVMSLVRNLVDQGNDGDYHPPGYDQLQPGYRRSGAHSAQLPFVALGKIPDATVFLDLLQQVLSGCGHNRTATADPVVLRLMTPEQMSALDLANGGNGHDSGYTVWYDDFWRTDAQGTQWWLYFSRIGRSGTVGPLLQLVAVSNVVQRQVAAGSPAAVSGLVLDGDDVLADNVAFSRKRDDVTNQITLKGVTYDPAAHETSDEQYSTSYADLMVRYGASTKTVESQIIKSNLPNAAAALLPDRADAAPRWATDSLSWTTRGLTDAELDHYAPLWYLPAALPNPAAGDWFVDMARPIAVVNIDPDKAVAGPLLSGHLTGGVMTISQGEITIDGTMQARYLPTSAGALTWAQLRASGVSGAVYRAAVGLEWDATGHAGAHQLVPADLRQVKA